MPRCMEGNPGNRHTDPGDRCSLLLCGREQFLGHSPHKQANVGSSPPLETCNATDEHLSPVAEESSGKLRAPKVQSYCCHTLLSVQGMVSPCSNEVMKERRADAIPFHDQARVHRTGTRRIRFREAASGIAYSSTQVE